MIGIWVFVVVSGDVRWILGLMKNMGCFLGFFGFLGSGSLLFFKCSWYRAVLILRRWSSEYYRCFFRDRGRENNFRERTGRKEKWVSALYFHFIVDIKRTVWCLGFNEMGRVLKTRVLSKWVFRPDCDFFFKKKVIIILCFCYFYFNINFDLDFNFHGNFYIKFWLAV